jgi:hypothetical protein
MPSNFGRALTDNRTMAEWLKRTTFWRSRRDELPGIAYGASHHVLSESARIAIERMVDEWIKADLDYIRGELYQRALAIYERRCEELFGAGWRGRPTR